MPDPNNEILIQQSTPNITEKLQLFHADMSLFDSQIFQSLLNTHSIKIATPIQSYKDPPPHVNIQLTEHEIPLISSPAEPQILIEDYASFCVLLLTLNQNNTEILMHSAITGTDPGVENQLLLKYQQAISVIQPPRMTIVTGMWHEPVMKSEFRNSVQKIQSIIGGSTSLHWLLSDSNEVKKNFGVTNIDGIVTLPSQLSKDRKRHIFLLGFNPGEEYSSEEQIRQSLGYNS